MMSTFNDNTIPKGPPDLCFDSSGFVEESFSVDQFLQDHRNKANLETMRDDLGIYLKVLRSAMIELINKDYADFVNLSSNLIGLDKAISNIQTPLGQLKEELMQVRQSLDDAMSEVTLQLNNKHEIRNQKRSLRSLNRVQTALKKLKILIPPTESGQRLETLTLERAISEFNQLQFNRTKCNQHLSKNDEQVFNTVEDILLKSVDQLFLDSIVTGEKGKPDLARSLSFYLMLGKQEQAERLYRQSIVAATMHPLINEETLRSLPRGLPALYEKILSFVDKDMKNIREVTKEYDKFPGIEKFDFFIRSFWPEVEEKLEVNLTSIYAAGDPDVFYQRYCETLNFVGELGNRCNSSEALNELHSHPCFTNFMDRWDLPVYFQIRFQDIVKTIENSFIADNWASKSGDWELLASETVWQSMNRCWENGVFLSPIAHKFWKLSLQIISRYQTWIEHILSKKKSSKEESTLNFHVSLYSDIEMLVKRLSEFEVKALAKLPGISERTSQLLHESLEESKLKLHSKLENVNRSLIQCLNKDSNSILRQVGDIPRLFRRTNRETPTKPCPYVASLLELPTSFHMKHQAHSQTQMWLQTLFSDITKHYYSSVAEVLTSVQKTEESLRRLKKARDRSTNINSPNDRRAGDDDKIRLQLLLDVCSYLEGVEKVGIQRSSVEKLDDLLLLVENTQKSNRIS